MHEIVLATNNPSKITELQALIAPIIGVGQALLGVESPEETGLSFVENALIKARYASQCTGKPALADDSGLVVDCLQGRPGIYSARYAGIMASAQSNLELLLEHMLDIPDDQRQAYFYSALVLVQSADDPVPIITTGQWKGSIARSPSGTEGFGYDPIFYLSEYQCTAAELPAAVKNKISHRAQALQALRHLL